jgi:hypothetical protein
MVFTLVNLFAATNKIDLQNITQILFKVLFNIYKPNLYLYVSAKICRVLIGSLAEQVILF